MNNGYLITIASGACFLLLLSIALVIRSFYTIRELSKRIRNLEDATRHLATNDELFDKNLNRALISIDDLIDSHNAFESNTSDKINDVYSKMNNYEKTNDAFNNALQKISEIEKEINDDLINRNPIVSGDTDGDKRSTNTSIDFVDIVNDTKKLIETNEDTKCNITYRWIFPSSEKSNLVYGQWYIVVGEIKSKVKSDGSPLIFTDDGMWNGKQFVTSEAEFFDKVYAYIKMPDSGDIMEAIVELALRKD